MPNNHTTVGAYCIRPIFAAILLLICATAFAQQKGTFTDPRDKKNYKTTKIGEQVWMAENLNYEAEGSKCYKNEKNYCLLLGRLYDWETANKVCPSGWHLPSQEEWQTLVNFAGGDSIAGKKLKAEDDWNDYKGKPGYGTDEFGFSARPGGYGDNDSIFKNVGYVGVWWHSNAGNNSSYLHYVHALSNDYYGLQNFIIYDSNLFSVRCLMDTQPKTTFTDPRDSKEYKTAKIGEQIWMAENLNYAAESSRCYNDSTAYCQKYGRLYNWETATKACPSGWHLPSQKEFQTLRANDVSEFSGLLGGLCNSSDICYHIGQRGSWWSTTSHTKNNKDAYSQIMSNSNEFLKYGYYNKTDLLNVRCVKDQPTITDKEIQTVIDANMQNIKDIKRIYGAYLGKEPNATLILAIAPNGEIIKTEVIYSATDITNYDKFIDNKETDFQWKVIKIDNNRR